MTRGRGNTEIQTLIFFKPEYTKKSALSWAKRHNFKASKTDSKKNTIRVRQQSPKLFKKDSFRTIVLKGAIHAVVAKRRKAVHTKSR